jgi:hypothetical protein
MLTRHAGRLAAQCARQSQRGTGQIHRHECAVEQRERNQTAQICSLLSSLLLFSLPVSPIFDYCCVQLPRFASARQHHHHSWGDWPAGSSAGSARCRGEGQNHQGQQRTHFTHSREARSLVDSIIHRCSKAMRCISRAPLCNLSDPVRIHCSLLPE